MVVGRNAEKPAVYPAWIDTGSHSLLLCELQDASDHDAKLFIASPWRLPETFLLRFSPTAQTGRLCSVQWRGDQHLGVHFTARTLAVEGPTGAPTAAHQR